MEPADIWWKDIESLDKKLRHYMFEVEKQRTECEYINRQINVMANYVAEQKEEIQEFLEVLDNPEAVKSKAVNLIEFNEGEDTMPEKLDLDIQNNEEESQQLENEIDLIEINEEETSPIKMNLDRQNNEEESKQLENETEVIEFNQEEDTIFESFDLDIQTAQEEIKVLKNQIEISDFIEQEKQMMETRKLIIQNEKHKPTTEEQQQTQKILEEGHQFNTSNETVNKQCNLALHFLNAAAQSTNTVFNVTDAKDTAGFQNSALISNNQELENVKVARFKFEDGFMGVTFDEIKNDSRVKRTHELKFREYLSEKLNKPMAEIVILKIVKGSEVIYTGFKDIDIGQLDNLRRQIRKDFPKHFKGLNVEDIVKTLNISLNDLDPRYNFAFPNKDGDVQTRGGHPYYQPNNQWVRIALKVSGLYDNGNDDWLKMHGNPNEWAVGFHGTSSAGLTGITKERKINRKVTDAYNKGFYYANKIEISEQCYASSFSVNGKKYKGVFIARLHPQHMEFVNEDQLGTKGWQYRTIRDSKYGRPYGICIKEY